MVLDSVSTTVIQTADSTVTVILVIILAVLAYLGSWIYRKIFE